MPYCPKCDMEFVDGITVCSDCGGPLLGSEEEAKNMKIRYEREMQERQRAAFEKAMAAQAQQAQTQEAVSRSAVRASRPSSGVYVDKQQKYEELKSSATAFYLVGGVLTLVSILFWTGIIHLPMATAARMLIQGVLTAMGVASLIVAVKTSQSAKGMTSGIAEEKNRTREIIDWFCEKYSADKIDQMIASRETGLGEEELSLRRFAVIHDLLILGKDLTNASYVDALCEEIYTKLFES